MDKDNIHLVIAEAYGYEGLECRRVKWIEAESQREAEKIMNEKYLCNLPHYPIDKFTITIISFNQWGDDYAIQDL